MSGGKQQIAAVDRELISKPDLLNDNAVQRAFPGGAA
jgi:ABC-type branched-subunit amino acid transport system ATPase component|tara:strand:- start:570 stop:680 length:111 start_codon:yes stop_codon:yes gene_type:complete